MLIAGFPAEAFGTNCYIVAPGAGEQCVVIDPGIGVTGQLDDLLAEHRLHPVAVILTHGHLDHTFSVTPVCGARGIPAYIHPDDRALLADPALGLSSDMSALFGGRLKWTEPDDVVLLTDGRALDIAGLSFTVDHAPGHTRGSVLLRTGAPSSGALRTGALDAEGPVCFTGDVLFAGSVGRTDLPGGDSAAMVASLRDRILPLDDATIVLPGHGPRTTIGRERTTNPYLLELVDGPTPRRRGW